MIARLSLLAPLMCLLLALLVQAAPLADRDVVAAKKVTKNFYLLAAPTKSVKDPNAIGLNLVDPYYQPNYLLRVQQGGASYSQFNFTSGILSTMAYGPHGFGGLKEYRSNVDIDTGSVFFLPESGTEGLFSFHGNFLAYNGDVKGFRQCVGDLSQNVIIYKGTDATCKQVFIFQQLTTPPIE